MYQHLERGECRALRRVHNGCSWRVPSATFEAGTLTVEGTRGVPRLGDAPGGDGHSTLDEDAMFEATDQPFDFSRTNIGSGDLERYDSAKRRLGGRQPLRRSVPVALKQLQSLAEQPRSTKEPIGFVREEPAVALATRHGPTRNVDEV